MYISPFSDVISDCWMHSNQDQRAKGDTLTSEISSILSAGSEAADMTKDPERQRVGICELPFKDRSG